MAHQDIAISIRQLVGALASTRLPNVSNTKELGEATLNDARIVSMLEGLSTRYGWAPFSDMKGLHDQKWPEDMLWLWCMHSMWTSADCKHLLTTTCRAGWRHLTNCARFGKLSKYQDGKRPDLVCFLGPGERPNRAVFCELAFGTHAPGHPEKHKDYDKVTRGSPPWLPVNYV
ncbi:uncharacterized protein METZ01_LOCUS500367, partial [marine metagenome]